jgi:hypothetical protein
MTKNSQNINLKNSKEKPYLYLDGLKKIVHTLNGKEKIHIGIRPFGFHAGNKMALLAYPYLLCEEMEKIGKKPEFTIFISFNDFEPNELSYLEKNNGKYFYKKIADYGEDEEPSCESNIFCERTNIGNLPDPNGCCDSVVDHYEKIIAHEIKNHFGKRFSTVSFQLVRNSSLINNKKFREYLYLSLTKPSLIAKIISGATGEKTIPSQAKYAGAICPECKSAHGETKVLFDFENFDNVLGDDEQISFKCENCGKSFTKKTRDFDYWIYHKPLLLPRLIIFDIDLCIRGGDHYRCGSVDVNSALLSRFEPNYKKPKTLITPVVMDCKGNKMSKSYKNTFDVETEKVIAAAKKCETDCLKF